MEGFLTFCLMNTTKKIARIWTLILSLSPNLWSNTFNRWRDIWVDSRMPTINQAYDRFQWCFHLQVPVVLCISIILGALAACSHLYLPDVEIQELWALFYFYQEKLKIFQKLFWNCTKFLKNLQHIENR